MLAMEISLIALGVAIVLADRGRRGITFGMSSLLFVSGFAFGSVILLSYGAVLMLFGSVEGIFAAHQQRTRRLAFGVFSAGLMLVFFGFTTVLDSQVATDLAASSAESSSDLVKSSRTTSPNFAYVPSTSAAVRLANDTSGAATTFANVKTWAPNPTQGRLIGRSMQVVNPACKLIRLDAFPDDLDVVRRAKLADDPAKVLAPRKLRRLRVAHRRFEDWFLDGPQMGQVTHAMTASPKSTSTDYEAAQHPLEYFDNRKGEFRRDFTLTQLHLVGLSKKRKPVAYPLKTLPDLVHVARRPTRDLSDFETEALEKLAAGKRVHYQWQGDWLRMMGAIRSHDSCQQCHIRGGNLEAGHFAADDSDTKQQLLGAFSYELVVNRHRNYDWVTADHLLASAQ